MIKKILIGFGLFLLFILIIGFFAGEDTTESPEDKTVEATPVEMTATETETPEEAPEQVSVEPEPDMTPTEVAPVEDTKTVTPPAKVEKEAKEAETVKLKEKKADDGKLSDAKKAEIIEYFKGNDEPNVLDALFPYDTLKLGMHNDSGNRDGYAEYACEVLKSDFNVKQVVIVRIIDIDKLVSSDKWETIGEANCN
ncbi:hypothetical protein [Psychrobacter sp. FDAARGOS_221]|uniref:hypothetical protein n=1 Tax=Psychrobacter sp. FDAARGOS_221 TaxID=1975705 RepID=UPI000BB571A7|nr:hypothetical protein [Psychrobacter sp. FDAARGOS_221]PNK59915.1 hypothetical protein A6J60_002820 [Psychrobacter sp. FDAARGOS_221]